MKIGSIALAALFGALKVASVAAANNYNSYYQCSKEKPCEECEVAKDCDNDKECKYGLFCADSHKEELYAAYLDPRKANCEDVLDDGKYGYGKPDLGPPDFEVCFDPCILSYEGELQDWKGVVKSGGGDWSFYSDKAKFSFEDSKDCDYKGNPYTQVAYAETYINGGCDCGGYLWFEVEGWVEGKQSGYDRLEITVDGQLVMLYMSEGKEDIDQVVPADGGDTELELMFCNKCIGYPKKCKMDYPAKVFSLQDYKYYKKLRIDGGMHHIVAKVTTGDGATHDEAFYSVEVKYQSAKSKFGCYKDY